MKFPPLITNLIRNSFGSGDQKLNEKYRLVWSDEFENDGRPDSANWGFEEGFVRNNELQWYQPQNAFCEGGLLIIEGRKERAPNPKYKKGSKDWKKARKYIDYTSACVTTRRRHSWQYGRFEIKARIKSRAGLWPAIWTLGVEGQWPSNGEVDILECYKGQILANACWGTDKDWTPKWKGSKKDVTSLNDPQWEKKFHVWRMDWDEKEIKLYMDDILLNTIDLSKTINPKRSPKNPFHQPHYLLLNLAIGGNAAGDPGGTSFPTRIEIDYVRVYQKTKKQA